MVRFKLIILNLARERTNECVYMCIVSSIIGLTRSRPFCISSRSALITKIRKTKADDEK